MNNFGKIRALNNNDLERILVWRNDPLVRENMYQTHEISKAEHLKWCSKVHDSSDQKYFIYEKNGIPQGVIAFTSIDQSRKNLSWAFYVAPDSRIGIGSLMEYMAIEYAFITLGMHKIYCEVLSFNSSVIRLNQNLVFLLKASFANNIVVKIISLISIASGC